LLPDKKGNRKEAKSTITGMAFDPSRLALWAVSNDLGRVTQLDLSGNIRGSNDALKAPSRVRINAGSFAVVTDKGTGQNACRFHRFDPVSTALVKTTAIGGKTGFGVTFAGNNNILAISDPKTGWVSFTDESSYLYFAQSYPGMEPSGIIYDNANHWLWTANYKAQSVARSQRLNY
jgi:hypothetical protein